MGIIIKDIKRNNNEIIRVEVSEFKGRQLINIRIWYQAMDSGSGDVMYKPTQKGVTINISEFKELKDGIDRLGDYIADLEANSVPEQPQESPESITDEEENDKENDEDKDDEKKEDE